MRKPRVKRANSFESSIHVYRAMKRMPQQELADNKVNVSRQTIIQLEQNKYNPSLLLAYDITEIFEVLLEKIFTFIDSKKQTIEDTGHNKILVGKAVEL